ncbi:Holliday junction branch migration protein RuvA [Granulibacter bethesdensis]|uniref:Holliday junction branch migration complex subunit RuvA n=1 Tax=Granulibacter bethesdensis (strain ATCC BAA-1260 / CGDNIH1) TaxID=391165 RepID=Q0BT55_GRABC|nr:Holliday junction branch migration protein RuvA [Granulibacter bethesdensis]ABI61997.1 Holliday junction DNA helicase ruvA [Granulibacter bethesdensis CGDNIH1]AHJ69107.1 Holliday junction DNA helicase ruvA [Granulibacter bethesdensis]APH51816.1 Holliday junction DNA helicase ruvA [Granulibacter bethesdensis]APH64508.1 Holliday junction DNA helicase ruvA [Granulibacter bethesdensis]
MIGRLTGLVDGLEEDRCLIDVNGVGYVVYASSRTLAALPRAPEVARVLIETQVREDAITLFGFIDTAERDWFRLLTTVQGVGAKVGLNILSALSAGDLISALMAGDQRALTRASGVGPRLAARIVSELKDKVGAMPSGPMTIGGVGVLSAPAGGVEQDTLSALLNLGYRRPEALAAIRRVREALGEEAGLDAILRQCLRELAPG